MRRTSWLAAAGVAAALWLADGAPALAQSEDLPPPPPGYEPAVPELVSDEQADQLKVDHPFFTLRFGLVPIFDYTWLAQDQASVDQVGAQPDDFDIRSARILARGTIFAGSKNAPRYLVAFE
jgi:hypothetical protein